MYRALQAWWNTRRGFSIQRWRRPEEGREKVREGGWGGVSQHTSAMRQQQWRTQDFTGTHSNAKSSTSVSPPKQPRWASSMLHTPTRAIRQWPLHALPLMWGDSISCLMRCTDRLSRKQIHKDLGYEKNRRKRTMECFNLPAVPDGWSAEHFPIVCGQSYFNSECVLFGRHKHNEHQQQLWKRPHWFKGLHVRPYKLKQPEPPVGLFVLHHCHCWLWKLALVFIGSPGKSLIFIISEVKLHCLKTKFFLYVLGNFDIFSENE